MNLESLKNTWNAWSTKKKAIVVIAILAVIGGLASKDEKKGSDTSVNVATSSAPRQQPEDDMYYVKLSKLFPYDEDVMKNQGTREEMEKARKNEEELKAIDAQLIGKNITDWSCDTNNTKNQTYSAGSIFTCEASPGFSGGLHSYIWLRVPLSAENAKEIGTSYDKDKFRVTGTITKISREREVFAFHNPLQSTLPNDPNRFVYKNNLTIIEVSPGVVKLDKK